MAERKTYEVRPHPQGWQGKVQGGVRASVELLPRHKRLLKTKNLAKEAPLSQVIVKDRHNVIQTEYTYGKDPRRYVG